MNKLISEISHIQQKSRVVSQTEYKNSPLFLPWMSQKMTKGLIALTPEMYSDQTAMGLPPVSYARMQNASFLT
jgi:hypothetical protein